MNILPYCSLYKMAIFATFQNDVIFLNIKCVFSRVSPKISLTCVKSQFLKYARAYLPKGCHASD